MSDNADIPVTQSITEVGAADNSKKAEKQANFTKILEDQGSTKK